MSDQVPVVKQNPVVSFISGLWNKLVDVDTKINSIINKLTNGNAVIAIVVAFIVYYFVRPFVGLLVGIPAELIKVILSALTVIVPFLINSIPYILEVALGALMLVEVINFIKSLIKK